MDTDVRDIAEMIEFLSSRLPEYGEIEIEAIAWSASAAARQVVSFVEGTCDPNLPSQSTAERKDELQRRFAVWRAGPTDDSHHLEVPTSSEEPIAETIRECVVVMQRCDDQIGANEHRPDENRQLQDEWSLSELSGLDSLCSLTDVMEDTDARRFDDLFDGALEFIEFGNGVDCNQSLSKVAEPPKIQTTDSLEVETPWTDVQGVASPLSPATVGETRQDSGESPHPEPITDVGGVQVESLLAAIGEQQLRVALCRLNVEGVGETEITAPASRVLDHEDAI
jgi:hypothetical protein